MYKISKPINKCVISVYVETYPSLWQKEKLIHTDGIVI